MFTTPTTPSAPTLSTTTSPASPTSPRSGGFRSLSSLRSYTHSRLLTHSHSRENHSFTSRPPPNTTNTPLPTPEAHVSTSSTPVLQSAAASQLVDTTQSEARYITTNDCTAHESLHQVSPESTLTYTMTRSRAQTTGTQPNGQPNGQSSQGGENSLAAHLPSIRFTPHQDSRTSRPSLVFPPISRILPHSSSVIRVGRYSERDNTPDVAPNQPSDAAVGFKSKVVSRRHCEFWWSDNQWWIKDVKSSSGTFLNHIRLSQPGQESKPYALKDGDVVQLGIDFKGGEEMIFRCVKIRIECNRGWQNQVNTFNTEAYKRLLGKAKKGNDTDCAICLMAIAPCQALFVAPCSHVWHYKCIRRILNGSTWPNFLCPNCRAVAYLEADIDDPSDFEIPKDEEDVEVTAAAPNPEVEEPNRRQPHNAATVNLGGSNGQTDDGYINHADLAAAMNGISVHESGPGFLTPPSDQHHSNETSADELPPISSRATVQPLAISGVSPRPSSRSTSNIVLGSSNSPRRNLSPEIASSDCPMTPRNNAGPFILDGSAGRGRSAEGLRDSANDTTEGAHRSM